MKTKPFFKNLPAKKDDAEMYWECLRRRVDYITFCTKHLEINIQYWDARKQYGAASPQVKKICDDLGLMLYKANAKWGIGAILPPTKSFSNLTKAQKKGVCEIVGGFTEITLRREQLSPQARWHLFMLCGCKGHILPPDYVINILPTKRRFDLSNKGNPRKRADMKKFRTEMKAWDMIRGHQTPKRTWYEIGRQLYPTAPLYAGKRDAVVEDGFTRDEFTRAARNLVEAAEHKIRRCLDWRM